MRFRKLIVGNKSQVNIAKTLLIAFVLLSSIAVNILLERPLFVREASAATPTTWLTGFTYCKEITVTNPIDDYQSKIIVSKTSGGDVDCEGHCQDDFDDIRIAIDNATVLPMWIENYTSATQATIWFKNTYNDSTLFLYYGNSTVSTTSNATATFLFFDDFDSLDTNVWGGDTSSFTVSSGVLSCASSGKCIFHDTESFSDIAVRSKIRGTDATGARASLVTRSDWDGVEAAVDSQYIFYRTRISDDDCQIRVSYDSGDYDIVADTAQSFDLNTWYIQEARCDGNEHENVIDGTVVCDGTNTGGYTASSGYIGMRTHTNYGFEWDWIAVRKWTDTNEPSLSFGAEQIEGGGWTNFPPSFSNENPTNGSSYISLQPTISVDMTDDDGNSTDWWLWTSEDGGSTWTLRDSGTEPDGNRTISYSYIQAKSYNTTYYWKVSANDSHDNTTAIYHFTTTGIITTPKRIYEDSSRHLGFPACTKAQNGDFIVVFRNGSSHGGDNTGYIQQIRSTDNGSTWSNEGSVADNASYDDRDPAIVTAPNGDILLFSAVRDQYTWKGVYWYRSTDNGSTYTSMGSIYNNITNENAGDLCRVVTQLHVYGSSIYMATKENASNGTKFMAFYRSTDNGNTWTRLGIITWEQDEPGFVYLGNNTFIAVTRGTVNKQYNSTDGGYTWSSGWDITSDIFGSSGVFHKPMLYWYNTTHIFAVGRNYTATTEHVMYTMYNNISANWNKRVHIQECSDGGYTGAIINASGNNSHFLVWYSDASSSTNSDIWMCWMLGGSEYCPPAPTQAPTQSNQLIWDGTTEKTLNATDVAVPPTSFNITISDADGDKMNITIKTNESGTWQVVNQTSGSGLSNGTYSFTNVSWVDAYNTTYYISFNVTDGTDWTNETFKFTTIAGANVVCYSSIFNSAGNTVSYNWGNWTANPGDTNVGNYSDASQTFIKATNNGSADGTATISWSYATLNNTTTGKTIAIDNNIKYVYGTGTTPSAVSSWTYSVVDTDHSFQVTVPASSTLWVYYEIQNVGTVPSGTYTQSFTWTAT